MRKLQMILTLMVLPTFLVKPVAAAEKEFVYLQKAGKLLLDGKELGSGYSGHGAGKNNPEKEKEKNVGPIPQGVYKISAPREYKKMANCFDLTPIGHDAQKRTELMIHGDSIASPGTASRGCIVVSADIRKKIAESGVTILRVKTE
jgi:hypothetical protein